MFNVAVINARKLLGNIFKIIIVAVFVTMIFKFNRINKKIGFKAHLGFISNNIRITSKTNQEKPNRILYSELLGISKTETEDYKHNPQYIRVLGFTKNGEKILSKINSKSNMPVVTSVSKFLKSANEPAKRMIEKDILATNIYTLGYQVPNFRKSNLDYTMPIITN